MRQRLTRVTEVQNVEGYDWATTRWMRRQIYDGLLPSHRVAGRVLVDLDDLDALVEAGRRERAA